MTSQPSARILLVLLVAAFLLPAVLSACPLCKDAKSDTDYPGGAASLPKGFYYSILFMVSAPFAVIGGLVLRIHLARRRVRPLPSTNPAPEEGKPVASFLPDPPGARP